MKINLTHSLYRLATAWLCLTLLGVTTPVFLAYALSLEQPFRAIPGSDTEVFHNTATEISNRIRQSGWHAWEARPLDWGHVGISSAIYALLGANPIFLLPISALFLTAAFEMLRGCLVRFGVSQKIAVLAVAPLFFLPTTQLILTQWHKDVVGVPAALAIVYGCVVGAADRRPFLALLLIAAGVFGLWLVREHLILPIGIACGGGVLVAAAVVRWRNAAERLGWATLALCAACVMLFAFVLPNWSLERVVFERQAVEEGAEDTISEVDSGIVTWKPWRDTNRDGVAADSDGSERLPPDGTSQPLPYTGLHSGIDTAMRRLVDAIDRQAFALAAMRFSAIREMAHGCSTLDAKALESASEIVSYSPRALVVGMLAPFPNVWFGEACSGGGRILRLLGGAEMSLFYLAFLGIIPAACQWGRSPWFWFLLSSTAALLLLHGLVFVNSGTLMRARYAYVVVPVSIGIAGWWMMLSQCSDTRMKKQSRLSW